MKAGAISFVFFFLLFLNAHAGNKDKGSFLKEGSYVPGTVYLKMKPGARAFCGNNFIEDPKIRKVLDYIRASSTEKMFPHAVVPSSEKNIHGKKYVDLSLIYKIKYSGDVPVEKAIHLLRSTGIVEYAEPDYVNQFCYTPNDTAVGIEYHLSIINAFSAWDVWKGDTNTVIGIVDSGTDWDHPDLAGNIKYNFADPINGLDDDHDGFTDNFRGWDVSENDNNPMVGSGLHGVHVSGCAAATTDNITGIASPAFRCKFLPVKCSFDGSGASIDNGYEGIVYAADHGCSVINCSWGRSDGTPSDLEQDIINYATFNRNATVVAAAGNNGLEQDYWPAVYENVVCVAATNSGDVKPTFSNYGFQIDVSAPGQGIYSTWYNNIYIPNSGTSMASPVAAACVAMIRSKFPNLDALQAAEQLRISCDLIDTVSLNLPYANKLGGGRVNLFRALTDSLSPGIQVSNLSTTDGNDNLFAIGDTINITALFTNLLQPTSNLDITLSSPSSVIQVLDSSFHIGVLNTFDTISNFNFPFRLVVNPNAAVDTSVFMTITMRDGAYTDFYSFYIVVNVDYVNINVNNIATTITSFGRIGYHTNAPGLGLGIKYQNSTSLLFESSFMAGIDGSHVSDDARGAGSGSDHDFRALQRATHILPGVSDYDADARFDDSIATTDAPINILVHQKVFAWTTPADQNYIMMEYIIHNIGDSVLNHFHAGIFTDWDLLPNTDHNRVVTDWVRRMGYTFCTDSAGYYAGVKLLSFDNFNHYAIDNDINGQGGINLNDGDGFSTGDKYTSLSTNRDVAGASGQGNEVCDVSSTGELTIQPGDSVQIAFAILVTNDLPTLQAGAMAAQAKYDAIIGVNEIPLANNFDLFSAFPNPAGDKTTVGFTLSENSITELSLYNSLGEKVKTILKKNLVDGNYSATVDLSVFENGTYFFKLSSGIKMKTIPVVVIH